MTDNVERAAVLDRVPRWLRWVLFLPLGLLGALLVNVVVELVLDIMGLPNTPQTPPGMIKSGLVFVFGGLTVTWFPAALSPRPWAVGVVLFVVGVVSQMSPFLLALVSGRLHWSSLKMVAIANVIGYAVGGCVALLVIRQSRVR